MATFFGKTLGPDSVGAATDDDPDACCPTCMEAFDDGNPPAFTRCGHRFHLQCLYAWLERKQTCPLCDSAIELDGDDAEGGDDDDDDDDGEAAADRE